MHAFVTDPPYSSGGAFRGDRVKGTAAKYVSTGSANKGLPGFDGDVRDQRSFTLWTALWSSEAWRCAADGCHLVAFSDWRQLPALCDAVQAGGWLWRGICVWDKTEASRPRLELNPIIAGHSRQPLIGYPLSVGAFPSTLTTLTSGVTACSGT